MFYCDLSSEKPKVGHWSTKIIHFGYFRSPVANFGFFRGQVTMEHVFCDRMDHIGLVSDHSEL